MLIQLHEEIYAWGKSLDKINWEIFGPSAHETSTKARRLILKLLDGNLSTALLNENLKGLGFSAIYWENVFKVPTPVGYYMDSDSYVKERQFLRESLSRAGYGMDFWLATGQIFAARYLYEKPGHPVEQTRFNFPDVLANMIALAYQNPGSYDQYRSTIMQMLEAFEQPGACQSK